MMYTELGRSWKVSDESLSNAQFRISSNPRHGEESFGDHNDIKESSQHCVFCLSKQAILRQLWILKQAVEAKNKKIIELEQFIQRLSQMVLSQNAELTASEAGPHMLLFQQSKKVSDSPGTLQGCLDELPQSFNTSSLYSVSRPQSIINDFKSKASSNPQINQELTAFESQYAKSQIRRQIDNLSLPKLAATKNEENKESYGSKQGNLKKKLNEIIKCLPNSSSDQGLKEFESLSEPLNEGTPGVLYERQGLCVSKNWENLPRSSASKHDQSQVLEESKCRLAY